MSDDELEKLAAEMKNIKPSKTARKRGMDAAMAAFDAEFAAQNESAEEKISTPVQGSADEPRLTSQTTRTGRVEIPRSGLMAKFNDIFKTKQGASMLMGSCAAALIAALVIMPTSPIGVLEPETKNKFDSIATEMEPAGETVVTGSKKADDKTIASPSEREEVIVTGTRSADKNANTSDTSVAPVIAGNEADVGQIQSGRGIGPVNELLQKVRQDAEAGRIDNRSASESEIRQLRDRQARAALQQQQNVSLFVDQQALQSVPQYAPAPSLEGQSSGQSKQTQIAGGYILEEVPAEYKTETKTIVTKEASTELVTVPATFETVRETVVVRPPSTELVVIPPEYEWVDGEIEGSNVEYVNIPATYDTVQEAVVVQQASTELVTIPATYNADGTIASPAVTQERVIPSVTKMETRRVIKTPASTLEKEVPYEIRDGKTRVPVKPATVIEQEVAAVTKEVSRRVIKTPASTQERVTPAGTRQDVVVRTVVAPERFYLRDEDGNIVREFASRDAFEAYVANPVVAVDEKPVSTFSIDVDTASYTFMRASINRGQLPPASSIRLEEMINYFPYDYEASKSPDQPFKANVTVTPTPWNANTKLMHIGIKGYVPPVAERPASNIVFLIDTSGSMRAQNKLPLLINSFKLLLGTLDEDDTVSIVTYAGSAGTVLEPTPASQTGTIKAALNRLRSGGSTAGAAGLELAYQKAQENFDDEGVNRVILATDGDFNVGFSSPDDMKRFIEEKRETGIFLSVLGFGMGNYNDHLMQSLAQNGNGVAAYIDSLAEANKVLADEAGSALFTIAKDVKIQVEFNPAKIAEYRLIGYETRALKREDFNNDKVDAGEINAGHTVTAIYEMTPVGSPAIMVDNLRYGKDLVTPAAMDSDEFAFVKIRHKLPNADKSTLQTFPIGSDQERSLTRASDDMRFATAVAAVGQKLRGDSFLEDFSYDDAIELATRAKGEDTNGYRAEFIQLVRLMDSLEE